MLHNCACDLSQFIFNVIPEERGTAWDEGNVFVGSDNSVWLEASLQRLKVGRRSLKRD